MALQIHSFLCLKAQTMGLNYDLCPTLRYTWAGLSWGYSRDAGAAKFVVERRSLTPR